jgi:hypothetical protein
MRSFSLVTTILALLACNSTCATEPESGDLITNSQSFGLRISIEANRAYDSPLYEGLLPTTLEMFEASDRQTNVPTKLNFAWPVIPADDPKIEQQQVVPDGMVIASNDDLCRFQTNNFFNMYNSPLYDGLYPMTIEAFKRADEPKDKEVFAFCIAFNR